MFKRTLCITAVLLALFSTTASAASVTLEWDPSPAAHNVAGYTLSIRRANGVVSIMDVGKVTSHTFRDLANGAKYRFSVRAYTDTGMQGVWAPELAGMASASVSILSGTASIPRGKTGSWTAAAAGLDGVPEYRFRRYSALTGWTVARPYSADPTLTWKPTGAEDGQYLIEVSARTAGSNVANDAAATTGYVTVGNAPPFMSMPARVDLDGDGLSDFSVYRPKTGMWHALLSGGGYSTTFARGWGEKDDLPVPGDYDGDGRTDLAVYRPDTNIWYVLRSDTNYTTTIVKGWGAVGDVPVPADYDGDGRADVAVFRPSTSAWYILRSDSNHTVAAAYSWGMLGDVPVPADYDGDGKTDLAVFRPSNSTWHVLHSSTGYTTTMARAWGMLGDRPVVGDYDGDRRADLAVYRAATGSWYVLQSTTGFTTTIARVWGTASDIPVPLNFTSASRANLAFFRPSTSAWWVADGPAFGWGAAGDTPLGSK